ncbi:MAG: hypothetical protein M3388_16665 [Acidobacteriota bacterium]|nr:hypothetical protein [Acidobacteriota bacterium]
MLNCIVSIADGKTFAHSLIVVNRRKNVNALRRLARLTNAFSKKWCNLKCALALFFAYYSFVRTHRTLRCTPAMAHGIEKTF